jgi:cell division protein FtsZ
VIDESLGDEVKITVIATGFDEGSRRPNQAQMVLSEEPKKAPSFEPKSFTSNPPMEARKPLFNPKPASVAGNAGKPATPPEIADDELDIPAFIRKKMR